MNPWALSALWVGLALVATLLANWSKFLTLLSVIIAGTVAQMAGGVEPGIVGHRGNAQWLAFPACTEAVVLAFLAALSSIYVRGGPA